MDVPLNIAFRVRVSVVCIQCEQTQREREKKKNHVQPNKYTGQKGRGNNQSEGRWGGMSLEEIRTVTQINLKNMV